MNILEKSGSWYSYNSERIAQGRDNVKEYLKSHPDILNEIEAKIRTKLTETDMFDIPTTQQEEISELEEKKEDDKLEDVEEKSTKKSGKKKS